MNVSYQAKAQVGQSKVSTLRQQEEVTHLRATNEDCILSILDEASCSALFWAPL